MCIRDRVNSGLVTFTDYGVSEASRISLPESFSWPVKTCNLKRCMLEARIPVEGTDRELVLINFHLEAYDSGEGKEAQSRILAEKLKEEYAKGNYAVSYTHLDVYKRQSIYRLSLIRKKPQGH